jgi:hypothetical protein
MDDDLSPYSPLAPPYYGQREGHLDRNMSIRTSRSEGPLLDLRRKLDAFMLAKPQKMQELQKLQGATRVKLSICRGQ